MPQGVRAVKTPGVSVAQPLTLRTDGPLAGTVAVPGDKSISHRALMFGALAVGETVIDGLLDGEDVRATASALRAMGADIEREDDGRWRVWGVGVGGLLQPGCALDMGNSGTSTRLLMGLVASHPVTATFIGDASLSTRPMGRVTAPLGLMGASFAAAPGGAPAADDDRALSGGGAALRPPGRLGAGQVRGAPRRTQHAGADGRRRGRSDARPQRTDAARLRRGDRD